MKLKTATVIAMGGTCLLAISRVVGATSTFANCRQHGQTVPLLWFLTWMVEGVLFPAGIALFLGVLYSRQK